MANNLRAGRITGSPTNGLCERICIEVQRVFDGCRESANNRNFTLELSGIPAQATPPFVFIRAESYGDAVFDRVTEEPLENSRACISGELTIPVLVTFSDVYGNRYTATSSIRMRREFVLRIPEQSVVPYSIKLFASFLSTVGTFAGDTSVSVNGCYIIIAKVIVPTDILVPTYGFCVYPECTGCEDRSCNVFFSLPLFPQ